MRKGTHAPPFFAPISGGARNRLARQVWTHLPFSRRQRPRENACWGASLNPGLWDNLSHRIGYGTTPIGPVPYRRCRRLRPQSMNQEKGAIGFYKLFDLSEKSGAGNNKILLPSEVGPETVAISGFQRLKS